MHPLLAFGSAFMFTAAVRFIVYFQLLIFMRVVFDQKVSPVLRLGWFGEMSALIAFISAGAALSGTGNRVAALAWLLSISVHFAAVLSRVLGTAR